MESILDWEPSFIQVSWEFVQEFLCNPADKPNHKMDKDENILSLAVVPQSFCWITIRYEKEKKNTNGQPDKNMSLTEMFELWGCVRCFDDQRKPFPSMQTRKTHIKFREFCPKARKICLKPLVKVLRVIYTKLTIDSLA